MFEIIPKLEVNDPCEWCEPQECYTASLWWGELLLDFYSKDQARLEPERLNQTACDMLKRLSRAIDPESDEVVSGDQIIKRVGTTIFRAWWPDFRPACSMFDASFCCINEEVTNGKD